MVPKESKDKLCHRHRHKDRVKRSLYLLKTIIATDFSLRLVRYVVLKLLYRILVRSNK